MWISAASAMLWIFEALLFDSDRYCTDELVQIARLINLSNVSDFPWKIQFYFEGNEVNICMVAPAE